MSCTRRPQRYRAPDWCRTRAASKPAPWCLTIESAAARRCILVPSSTDWGSAEEERARPLLGRPLLGSSCGTRDRPKRCGLIAPSDYMLKIFHCPVDGSG
jgi:hypothetical protein